MSSLGSFKSKILPLLVSSGVLGENAEVIGIVENSARDLDQFASTIQFVSIELKVNGVYKEFPLVCKFQCQDKERREKFHTGPQFHNEILVYEEIVPLFPRNIAELLPEFYFGKATLGESPEDDVVIVKSLIPSGYRQTIERLFLDFEHCALAFKGLGEFHGASLKLKRKNPFKFANKINRLMETRWVDKTKDEMNYFYSENAKRGVWPLMKNGEHLEVLNRFLDRLVNVFGIMKDILEVNELSILCHGDFCRNNIIFKYEDDRPIDVRFFDLATARYASPIIDISFFLFQNTTPELRRKHFQKDFLKIYLDAVRDVAGDDEAPTMPELWKEFQEHALYGYILAAFFVPIMMADHETVEVLERNSVEERVKTNLNRGGEKVTDFISDMVRDLITWGCLK